MSQPDPANKKVIGVAPTGVTTNASPAPHRISEEALIASSPELKALWTELHRTPSKMDVENAEALRKNFTQNPYQPLDSSKKPSKKPRQDTSETSYASKVAPSAAKASEENEMHTSERTWARVTDDEISSSKLLDVLDLTSAKENAAGKQRLTVANNLVEQLPMIHSTIKAAMHASGTNVEFDKAATADLSNMMYASVFKGNETALAAVESLQGKEVYRSIMICYRFLACLTRMPGSKDFSAIGKEGTFYAMSLFSGALHASLGVGARDSNAGFKLSENHKELVQASFGVAFTGCSALGMSVLTLLEELCKRIGYYYGNNPKELINYGQNLQLFTANFSQLLERNLHTAVVERMVVDNSKSSSAGKQQKKRAKVTIKKPPTIEHEGCYVTLAEKRFIAEYNSTITQSAKTLNSLRESKDLVLSDRLRLTKRFLDTLYRLSGSMSKALSARRSRVAALVKEERRRLAPSGIKPLDLQRILAEKITASEWTLAEAQLASTIDIETDGFEQAIRLLPGGNVNISLDNIACDFQGVMIHSLMTARRLCLSGEEFVFRKILNKSSYETDDLGI